MKNKAETKKKTGSDEELLESIEAGLDSRISRGAIEFAEVRLRHPALAAFETAVALLAALQAEESGVWTIRAGLTAILLLEAQHGSQLIWAVLTKAYLPMLGQLAKVDRRRHKLWESQWPYLLEAFVEAVAAYPGPQAEDKPCGFLRRQTEKRFIRDTRKLALDQKTITLVDMETLDERLSDDDAPWGGPLEGTRGSVRFHAEVAQDADELAELLNEAVGGKLPAECLELVEATVLRGEDLGAYVDHHFPGLTGKERTRTYKRVQKQRHRAIEALKKILPKWHAKVMAEGAEQPTEPTAPKNTESVPVAPVGPLSFVPAVPLPPVVEHTMAPDEDFAALLSQADAKVSPEPLEPMETNLLRGKDFGDRGDELSDHDEHPLH